MKAQVAIVMGSDSDLEVMNEAKEVLDQFGIGSVVRILSAHRTPKLAAEFARNAAKDGIKVVIAGAGMANHLAGAMAAHTIIPVIGVPIDASTLKGLDSLLSTVQMPPGVPVACVAIGKAGAKNAAFLAAEILALSDDRIQLKIKKYRRENEKKMVEKNEKLVKR